jgi:predicted dehydrogenase
MKNILLIGLGYHARRIYYPILQELQKTGRIDWIFIEDLESQREVIERYLKERNAEKTSLFTIASPQNKKLDKWAEEGLNEIVREEDIQGVIIATEPLAHLVYAKWALRRGLNVLMDKPISTYEGIIKKEGCSKRLIKDYYELNKIYEESKKQNPNQVFAIMAQRRFHNVFRKMKEAIREVYEYTNCPVTSIQSFHSDGQWRFPTEIIEQTAHPYNQGYGKCSHSGYHFFDIVSWLMEAAEGKEKKPDEVEVLSSFLSPNDFIHQFTYADYRKAIPDFDKYNKYPETQFEKIAKDFGEIDSFNNLTFKKKGKVMTLASINLCHNGFSQRNWATAEGKDLYKGNGRVRQEMHLIEQGAFQSLLYVSFQTKEVNPDLQQGLFDFGGESHADLYISRNSMLNPKWKCIEKFQAKDLIEAKMKDKSRGHQEDARREATISFIDHLEGKNDNIRKDSDLTQYERSVKLMAGSYQSMARRKAGKNPLVKIKL